MRLCVAARQRSDNPSLVPFSGNNGQFTFHLLTDDQLTPRFS